MKILGVRYISSGNCYCANCLTWEWIRGYAHNKENFDAPALEELTQETTAPHGLVCSVCGSVIIASICNDCGDRYDCHWKNPNGPSTNTYGGVLPKQRADNGRLGIKCVFNSKKEKR
jgi:hypothetical protein